MSVLIKDMEKPKFCYELIDGEPKRCPFVDTDDDLPSAQTEQRWIPFILRPATDEEKEENSGLDYYLDGKLPEDGQKILITVRVPGHKEVQVDEFYSDADGSYLDGLYEIGTEAVAWMPMPEPYKGGSNGEN